MTTVKIQRSRCLRWINFICNIITNTCATFSILTMICSIQKYKNLDDKTTITWEHPLFTIKCSLPYPIPYLTKTTLINHSSSSGIKFFKLFDTWWQSWSLKKFGNDGNMLPNCWCRWGRLQNKQMFLLRIRSRVATKNMSPHIHLFSLIHYLFHFTVATKYFFCILSLV